jgi:4-hydroxy-tetrahydrodipicolinate reductase
VTTNIIICGACGKMGKEIAACVLADPELSLAGCVEYPAHPCIGKDYGTCIGQGTLGVTVSDSVLSFAVDKSVIIDFTSPAASLSLLKTLEKTNARIVLGTTGIDAAGVETIKAVSKTMPLVFSPNMSLGVNLLFILTEMVSQKLGETFDIEIVEAHHRLKKDSPSGTAVKLGEIAARAIGKTYEEAIKNGRVGIVGERSKKEIGMHAVRGGDIVGDHTVLFAGIGERLELRHMAHSRSTFARGAVFAAKWLAQKSAGLYSMRDVLGL